LMLDIYSRRKETRQLRAMQQQRRAAGA
jgi:hypothetical protein